MKRIMWLLLVLFSLAFSANVYAKDIKAAFIYVGPVGDGGWTYAHDQGRIEMEKLPFVTKTTFIESVPEGADATRVITGLANKGYNLIFTTSFGFMDPTVEVAGRFKDIAFEHCSGYKTTENMGNYFGRFYQGKYLSGIVAGSMTKSNIIGYVAAYPIPEVIRGINAFTLGVREVNPEATVKVVWTQTWFNPGLEKDAADSLLDVGADVLSMHQDTPATLQAAEERGKFAIGNDSDMRQFAPEAFLTAPIWDWGVLYKYFATEVHNGTWKPEEIWWGMETGVVKLAPLSDKVPQKVQALVAEKQQALMEHKTQVFTGPIKNQAGEIVLAAGKTYGDKELLSMNFFIEGVQGTIAK
ncbi:BMP family ABC transporter substrate-binding protein [uncultured Desulfuromusa sp.]|uniref:BMP family ABC transporter substrate-binding protein n=1 Tax=uncultured Desulfuromusa sp. TaxID=219183 RepID=UPI002AA942D1|nr:BMP family ABC transporter substrate-binding protein [uncultured Desulfuromusa sp.]